MLTSQCIPYPLCRAPLLPREEGKGVRSDVVAGKGVWKGVEDAREVAIRLAREVLEPEVKKEL